MFKFGTAILGQRCDVLCKICVAFSKSEVGINCENLGA